ncbi:MAG: transporter permease [Actinobacteria bacterium]|nr:transporter permease [Actinomycetota bacterium]
MPGWETGSPLLTMDLPREQQQNPPGVPPGLQAAIGSDEMLEVARDKLAAAQRAFSAARSSLPDVQAALAAGRPPPADEIVELEKASLALADAAAALGLEAEGVTLAELEARLASLERKLHLSRALGRLAGASSPAVVGGKVAVLAAEAARLAAAASWLPEEESRAQVLGRLVELADAGATANGDDERILALDAELRRSLGPGGAAIVLVATRGRLVLPGRPAIAAGGRRPPESGQPQRSPPPASLAAPVSSDTHPVAAAGPPKETAPLTSGREQAAMTATLVRAPARPPAVKTGTVATTISDILAVTNRNLIRYVRVPTLLVFSTIQPVMFVLLFRYVFGSAIRQAPGFTFPYVDYLMPGIFVQTVIFGSTQTGVGLAEDLTKGMIDRFRSLPMARSAVLAGRTLSDTVRNAFVVLLMSVVGYLVGFRIHAGLLEALAGVAVALAFGLCFSWISALIGLAVRDVESTQAASFVWIFPLVFASTAFVPLASLPGWLQAWAKINPVSVTVDALRALLEGWPSTTYHLDRALAWVVVILVVFVPLSVRKYRRSI